jgi:putative solute:sodium symporter small subunit
MMDKLQEYWQKNLKLIRNLLIIWAVVAYGLGILLAPLLNNVRVFGGPPLGFWIAQQGAIWIFVILIFVYAAKTQRLDREYELED